MSSLHADRSFGAVEQLGRFVASIRYESLPHDEQVRAKIHVLDAIACAVAAEASAPAERALAFARSRAAGGPSSFWFAGTRGSVDDCVFANSVLAHAVMLDDSPHCGSVVIPTAFALGEAASRSGRDILAAIVAGYELLFRLESAGLTDQLDRTGFRRAAMPGAFATAATGAYLRGLSARGVADALALSVSTCAPGSYEPVGAEPGTSERYIQLAANARAGVLAADMAANGFTGNGNAFEGEAGLFAIYRSPVPPGLVDGLGERWFGARSRVKPYPCGTANTAAIFCAEEVVREHAVRFDAIVDVDLRIGPWGHMAGTVFAGPFTNLEQALFSAPFCTAATLVYGKYDRDVLFAAIGDPRVDAVARRVRVIAADVPRDAGSGVEASMTIALTGGQTIAHAVGDLPATIKQPSWDAMADRFHRLATALPERERERIIAGVSELDRQPDCTGLVELLRRPAA